MPASENVEQLLQEIHEICAQTVQDRNQGNRDAGTNQSILDGGCAGLVFEKSTESMQKCIHGAPRHFTALKLRSNFPKNVNPIADLRAVFGSALGTSAAR